MNLFKLIAGHIEEAVRLLVREGGLGKEALSVPISVEPIKLFCTRQFIDMTGLRRS